MRLLDQVRSALRARHYSPRTETAYVGWVRRFIKFNAMRHPSSMGADDINRFLAHLAVDGHVSASTQSQACSAILFLYADVLRAPVTDLGTIARARRPHHLPVVLTRVEIDAVLLRLGPPCQLMATLMYGSGLRLMECCTLRVKDIDLERGELTVREGKGAKDRLTMVPARLRADINAHLAAVQRQHEADLRAGHGSVALPGALHEKYPRAPWEWPWQWVSPATRHYVDPVSGHRRRHHFHETALQRRQGRRSSCRSHEAGDVSQPAALLRDTPARSRVRHQDDSGIARSPERGDDDDLHPRAEPRRTRRQEPAGPVIV